MEKTYIANRLEMVLGVPAKFWINLEAIYREKLLLIKQENQLSADIRQYENVFSLKTA